MDTKLRPGYEGVAASDDGLIWRRAKDQPDPVGLRRRLRRHGRKAASISPGWWNMRASSTTSTMRQRAAGSRRGWPFRRPAELEAVFRITRSSASGPGVRRAVRLRSQSVPRRRPLGDVLLWGRPKRGAYHGPVFPRLLHWTAHPEPLYKAGGHPGGLDKTIRQSISLGL